jgi:hypothetical protein
MPREFLQAFHPAKRTGFWWAAQVNDGLVRSLLPVILLLPIEISHMGYQSAEF